MLGNGHLPEKERENTDGRFCRNRLNQFLFFCSLITELLRSVSVCCSENSCSVHFAGEFLCFIGHFNAILNFASTFWIVYVVLLSYKLPEYSKYSLSDPDTNLTNDLTDKQLEETQFSLRLLVGNTVCEIIGIRKAVWSTTSLQCLLQDSQASPARGYV